MWFFILMVFEVGFSYYANAVSLNTKWNFFELSRAL